MVNASEAEYQRSNATTSSGAITAWNNGGRGQGITVGVIDTGINAALSEFAGRVSPASADLVANRGVADSEGHGTAVSAVIAANHDGSDMMGVAFESTILSLNTSNPNDCDPKTGCTHSDSDIARAIDIARTNGARVINISLGGDSVGASLLAAAQRAAAAGIVIVLSAGNASGTSPEGFAASVASQGNGTVIIAGAMDANRTIASFSNQAGTSAAYYLVALGVRVRSLDQNGTPTLWSGTSFSAPIISGAVALLASAFPNLTGSQIVHLLLSTGDDAGAAGVDPVYGNGILNIARAFAPSGTLTLAGSQVALADTNNGQGSPAMGDARPRMAGAIILDGYSRAYVANLVQQLRQAPVERPLSEALQNDLTTGSASLRGSSVSITVRRDLIGHPEIGFAQTGMSHDDAVAARTVAAHALSRLTPRTAIAFGFSESGRTLLERLADDAGTPFLIARDPASRPGFYTRPGFSIGARQQIGRFGLTLTGERGTVDLPGPRLGLADPRYTLAAIALDRRLGRATVSASLSRLAEEGTVLGGRFAFASGGATSWFADASARYEFGAGWEATARYRRGSTSMPGTGSLVTGGTVSTDSWAFDLARRNAFARGDRFALRVTQPLRVRSGGYALNLPVSYDYADLAVGYAPSVYSLAPTGREVDFEAAYGIGLVHDAAFLSGNAFVRRNPGNIETAATDIGSAIRFSLRF